ncbi:MAG: DinB family protein [Saprospiraceae bacterium]
MQSTQAYLQNLTQTVEHIIKTVEEITQTYAYDQLAQRPEPNRWSVLDNLEHLNLYNDFYLPTFVKIIDKGEAKGLKPRLNYRAGWLGNYLTNSMKPKGTKIANKMNTFKDKNPILTAVPANVIERFFTQHQQLLQILKRAARTDIQKLRMPTTLGSFPTIRLGDGLAFVIGHEERHLLQIQNTLRELNSKTINIKIA